jgi:hypothetical protein
MSYAATSKGLEFTLPAGSTLYALFTAYDLSEALARSEADRLTALGLRVVVYQRSQTVKTLMGPLAQFQDKAWTWVVCVFNPTTGPLAATIGAEVLASAETVGIEKVLDDGVMRDTFTGGAIGVGLLSGLAAVLVLKLVKGGRHER